MLRTIKTLSKINVNDQMAIDAGISCVNIMLGIIWQLMLVLVVNINVRDHIVIDAGISYVNINVRDHMAIDAGISCQH